MPIFPIHEHGGGVLLILFLARFAGPSDRPAGKSPRTFLNIQFRIVAYAKGKKFEKFAGEVFVGRASAILRAIQVK